MNRIFSWLQTIILRQIIVIFLVGFAFFGLQVLNYGNEMLMAAADTVKTPEGIYYKGTPDYQGQIKQDKPAENVQKKLKERADDVREKLNLDQQPTQATKEFLESVQTKVEQTVKPLTGTKHGYYQENIPEKEIRSKK